MEVGGRYQNGTYPLAARAAPGRCDGVLEQIVGPLSERGVTTCDQ
jgi:hypothetical protein